MTNKESYNLQVKVARWITALLCFLMVPILADGKDKKCQYPLNWSSGPVTFMVNECFKAMNKQSITSWGAPIQPFLGMNHCSCVTDAIRTDYPCQEDYSKFTLEGTSDVYIAELSKKCILNGSMGDEVKKAYINLGGDNATTSDNKSNNIEIPMKVEKSPPPVEPTKDQPTWGDLINK